MIDNERRTWNGKEKTAFRRTVAWRKFRLLMVKSAGNRCELCGRKKTARQLDVHHVTPADYSLLEADRFKVLCTDCHYFVEHIVFVATTMPRSAEFLAWAGEFLPKSERKY